MRLSDVQYNMEVAPDTVLSRGNYMTRLTKTLLKSPRREGVSLGNRNMKVARIDLKDAITVACNTFSRNLTQLLRNVNIK